LVNAQLDREVVEAEKWTKGRLKLIPFNNIKLGKARRYLVKGLIPYPGLTVLWGPPKSGKSFWTFDLVMRVALGLDYRDRRVHQGPVVYCCFEGQSGIMARTEAFRQEFLSEQAEDVPFYLQPLTMDLVKDHGELIDLIEHCSIRPVAVVLDTLNRSLVGSESSDQDMTAYVRAADVIRDTFNCSVLVVHHCGINDSRPRGHTSLTGATDAQLEVKRDTLGNIFVTVEWMKDGEEGDIIV
jgi:RecA-family ATPase